MKPGAVQNDAPETHVKGHRRAFAWNRQRRGETIQRGQGRRRCRWPGYHGRSLTTPDGNEYEKECDKGYHRPLDPSPRIAPVWHVATSAPEFNGACVSLLPSKGSGRPSTLRRHR